MDKQIEKQLKDLAKMKIPALQAKYAEIVGDATKESNRDKLLKGIARVLVASADKARAKETEAAKAKAKQEKKPVARDSKPKKGAKTAAVTPASTTQAPANGGADAATGTDAPAAINTEPNGPDNAPGAATGAPGTKPRGPTRAAGERDPRLPPAGTVLTREYKGNTIKVTLLQDNGCLYEGRQYRSLSGLVKELTGTNHNGILWFNLIKRPTKAKPAPSAADSTAPAEPTQLAPAEQSHE